MGIYIGKCKICGNGEDDFSGKKGIALFENTDLCLTCTRLNKMEKDIEELKKEKI